MSLFDRLWGYSFDLLSLLAVVSNKETTIDKMCGDVKVFCPAAFVKEGERSGGG